MVETRAPYDYLLLSHREKLDDRFSQTQVFHPNLAPRIVSLVVSVEILNPWHPTAELGREIITSLLREFSRSESQSILASFEESLKKTNRLINETAERLKTPVSVAAAVLIGNEIHLAACGNAHILLFRNNKLVSVGDLKKRSAQFESVTSGDLGEGDWLMLANAELDPLVKSLGGLLAEPITLEELEHKLVEAADPSNRNRVGGIIMRHNRQGQHRTLVWEEKEPVVPLKLPKVNLPKINLSSAAISLAGAARSLAGLARLVMERLRRFKRPKLPKFGLRLPTDIKAPKFSFSWRLLPIAIFIAALIAGSTFAYRQISSALQEEPPPATLDEKLAQVEPQQRLAFLNDNFNFDEYQGLSEENKDRLESLLSEAAITMLSPTSLAQLPQDIVAISLGYENPVVLDTSGELWIIDQGLPIKNEQDRLIIEPYDVAAFNRNLIVVSDRGGNVWLINDTPESPVALSLPTPLASGEKKLAKFQNNLYLYSLPSGDFYRAANFSGTLEQATLYASSSELGLAKVTDWGINGQIVTLTEDGQLSDFVRNRRGEVNLTVPISNSLELLTTREEDSRIFVLAGRALLSYQANGEPLGSYFIALKDIPNEMELGAGSELYFSSGKEIFTVKLAS